MGEHPAAPPLCSPTPPPQASGHLLEDRTINKTLTGYDQRGRRIPVPYKMFLLLPLIFLPFLLSWVHPSPGQTVPSPTQSRAGWGGVGSRKNPTSPFLRSLNPWAAPTEERTPGKRKDTGCRQACHPEAERHKQLCVLETGGKRREREAARPREVPARCAWAA